MSASIQKNTVIDQAWLTENKNTEKPVFNHVLDYAATAKGALMGLQLTQRGLKLGIEVSQNAGVIPPAEVTALRTNLGLGMSALNIPRLPSVTWDAIQSLSSLYQNIDDGISFQRKALIAVRNSANAMVAFGSVATFVAANPAVSNAVTLVDFVADSIDLQTSISDYQQLSKLEDKASGDTKEALGHSKHYKLLVISKTVLAIAMTVLGLCALALKAPLLPVVALIVLSLALTMFAIYNDLYKLTGKYKIISCDRAVVLS